MPNESPIPPPAFPEPGTEEFGTFVAGHFNAICQAFMDLVGKENFGKYCTFAMGTMVDKPQKGIVTMPCGNVECSLILAAMLVSSATLQRCKSYNETTDVAYAKVLGELQHHMQNTKPNKAIPMD